MRASQKNRWFAVKRILIRAKVSPFEPHDVGEVLEKSLTGNNSGNLLFAYSVTRLLDTGDVDLSFIADYQITNGLVDAQWINQNFDCVVLPLANSFRSQYLIHLDSWTKVIRQLTIPCVVVGIGIQMEHGEKVHDAHSYDDSVRAFVSAVLDHSSSMAVRGEITAEYLRHLGFSNIEVTGCPSFALAGPDFPIQELKPLTRDSVATVTGSPKSPAIFQQFMRKTFEDLPNCYFVPQFNDDLALMYYGTPVLRAKARKNDYPCTMDDPVFVNDRARFFVNIKSMLEFNRSTQFNYGSRIHGCISNIVCGVPGLLFIQDQRVGELASYHHLATQHMEDLKSGKSIFDYYEEIDLSYMREGHNQRFQRLLGFLDANGIPHVWKNGTPTSFPADEKLQQGVFPGPVRPLAAELPDGLRERVCKGQRETLARLDDATKASGPEKKASQRGVKRALSHMLKR